MSTNRGELQGKVAIVTGGAMGIGRAAAEELGRSGASVVIADLKGAEEAAAELGALDIDALGLTVDVSSRDDTLEMARRCVDRFGQVDVLVNNAAAFATIGRTPFEDISVSEWQHVMNVNVLGYVLCAQAVVPVMRRIGGGRILNVTSATFFKGVPFKLHYVTSKGAIVALTRALATELGSAGILVNAVAPGFTLSDGVLQHPGEHAVRQGAAVGARAIAREQYPEDLVGAIRFLVGPGAGFITGQTLVVDGGAYYN
jgi:NAD(P)-dependent dehydrogenase (short-subunit alcohol dehydrogenase family)